MSPSRQQTTRNETTKETYDNMDIDEPQKNLPTSRSSTSSRTTTITSQEQKRQEQQQQQLDKEVNTTVVAQQQQQQQQATGNYYTSDINALVQSALSQTKVD